MWTDINLTYHSERGFRLRYNSLDAVAQRFRAVFRNQAITPFNFGARALQQFQVHGTQTEQFSNTFFSQASFTRANFSERATPKAFDTFCANAAQFSSGKIGWRKY